MITADDRNLFLTAVFDAMAERERAVRLYDPTFVRFAAQALHTALRTRDFAWARAAGDPISFIIDGLTRDRAQKLKTAVFRVLVASTNAISTHQSATHCQSEGQAAVSPSGESPAQS